MIGSSIRNICVYCGSADGLDSVYLKSAEKLGSLIAQNQCKLIYGAGKTGLMGAVADGVLNSGGQVIGVVPENLNQPQLIHASLTHLEVVKNIHLRKARMSELADAFIALPGGYGTWDEFFEILTWAQIGIHQKPIGLLNTREYYDPIIQMINRARDEKFIYAEHQTLLIIENDPDQLLTKLAQFTVPQGLERWVNR